MTLVWLLVVLWLADACCSVVFEGPSLLAVGSVCTAFAAAAAWRLFVRPSK